MIRQEITDYIEQQIIPRYRDFDKAHNVDHAETVIAESAALAEYYPQADREMVYVIAAFHDTGLVEGRERHHLVSAEILLTDPFMTSLFSEEQMTIMAHAVEDHRASSQHEPRSIYGRIVAEADRIISSEVTLRRTVQYGLKHNPTATMEQHYDRFCDHLQTKYAEGGYLKLYIAESGNGKRLAELRKIIADPAELRRRFEEEYYRETH